MLEEYQSIVRMVLAFEWQMARVDASVPQALNFAKERYPLQPHWSVDTVEELSLRYPFMSI